MAGFRTLEEALAKGRGRERPFRCPVHGDRHASASVNVIKGLWFCYVCGAKGTVEDVIEAPDYQFGSGLVEMLDEQERRVYPESWLDQFTRVPPKYWLDRFTPEAVEHFRLGYDPFRQHFGEHRPSPCYPLRDPHGQILGVVYRQLEHQPKYVYPPGSRVSDMLFGYTVERTDEVALVEGAADVISAWEAGVTAWALFGSQISRTQLLLLQRAGVRRVLMALDNDAPGQAAIDGWHNNKGDYVPGLEHKLEEAGIESLRLDWGDLSAKDLGELDLTTRTHLLRSLHT